MFPVVRQLSSVQQEIRRKKYYDSYPYFDAKCIRENMYNYTVELYFSKKF